MSASQPQPPACLRTKEVTRLVELQPGEGSLTPEQRAALEQHALGCGPCTEELVVRRAALATLTDLEVSQRAVLVRMRVRGERRRVGLLLAGLVVAGVVVWLWTLGAEHGDARPPSRAERIVEARRLHMEARFVEALAASERLVTEEPDRSAQFEKGLNLLRLDRRREAATALRAAAAAAELPGADGVLISGWYVASHMAQALLSSNATPAEEAEFEQIVRVELAGPGVDLARHRAMLWSELATMRALSRGDVAGGEAALAEAERENELHREATARELGTAGDVHYVLHARFVFAEAVRADSEAGRAVARDLRAIKERWAADLPPDRAWTTRGDALEWLARPELLAARRGDPADLPAAHAWLSEALALRERGRNLQGLSWCCASLGLLELLRGEADTALGWCERAVAHAVQSGDRQSLLAARIIRAQALLAAGRTEEARAAYAELRAMEGASSDAPRALTLAALAAALDPDDASGINRLTQALSSPLGDVRRVARRTLDALEAGSTWALGSDDLMVAP